MKVREPVARPLDVVSVELLLSASQAFLVGVLLYLAVGIWEDRGVGFGPVAVVLALLGLAIGGSWLYWLLGGIGWPLAAADVPAAMFLGFALVLGWRGEDLVRVEGAPLLLGLAASVYGVACGVFLDSPRRWRWDQRLRPRPGTAVPRISPTTRSIMAQVPRSLPRRPPATAEGAGLSRGRGEPGPSLLTAQESVTSATADATADAVDTEPVAVTSRGGGQAPAAAAVAIGGEMSADDTGAAAETAAGRDDARPGGPVMPTPRLDRVARSAPAVPDVEPSQEAPADIELPTAIEPRAQRSPWAWAAPPEWNRDQDEEPPRGRTAGRS